MLSNQYHVNRLTAARLTQHQQTPGIHQNCPLRTVHDFKSVVELSENIRFGLLDWLCSLFCPLWLVGMAVFTVLSSVACWNGCVHCSVLCGLLEWLCSLFCPLWLVGMAVFTVLSSVACWNGCVHCSVLCGLLEWLCSLFCPLCLCRSTDKCL
ncbi:hypothetical protein BsWGS_25236 [Bradybaena similaris]